MTPEQGDQVRARDPGGSWEERCWLMISFLGARKDQIPGGQFQGGGLGQHRGRSGGRVQSAGGRSSVQFSWSVVSDSLWPHGLQHARLPCPSPTFGVYSNSCPLSWWCHPTISSSVISFSSRLHSLLASGSFPMSQYLASGGQCIRVSASVSVLPTNIQDWFPLG